MEKLPDNFYSLFNEDTINHIITCAICKGILKTPMVSRCSHSFCKNCIEANLKMDYKCPICNLVLFKENLFYNRALEEILKYLNKTEVKSES